MREALSSRFPPDFVVYTAFGYVSLAMHAWVFAPDHGAAGGGVRLLVIMANLLAGSWCFLQALRVMWHARFTPGSR